MKAALAALEADPVIRQAQRRILSAARSAAAAVEQLKKAKRALERHPDFLTTERAQRKAKANFKAEMISPAWWVHNGILGALEDLCFEDLPRALVQDADLRDTARTLRLWIEDDKRYRARQQNAAA